MGSHASFLQLQGQDQKDVDAIGTGKVDEARISERERALLDYVKTLTLEPAKVTDEQVERLRKTGWKDDQIFEASFVTALFAFFNRMADAYGLDYPPGRWMPPDLRSSTPSAPGGAAAKP